MSSCYTGDVASVPRVVGPHMVAYTTADNLALSAWFLGGATESQDGQGWREYLLDLMTNLVILPDNFQEPRREYKRFSGQKLDSVQCVL